MKYLKHSLVRTTTLFFIAASYFIIKAAVTNDRNSTPDIFASSFFFLSINQVAYFCGKELALEMLEDDFLLGLLLVTVFGLLFGIFGLSAGLFVGQTILSNSLTKTIAVIGIIINLFAYSFGIYTKIQNNIKNTNYWF